ncbi:RNA-directed DNA polymerase, eukaryota, reverse transcriptase zinc-binding domain protein [Tanacetum coccineum]|uniref:RNA-directed DNA polymerase, eukaryota, reverse transcriptase zinc-binding domain protein n=1 Tax=Tanacetum coccineum TaxID=301880 RepID=A0ABQ5EDD4_9ASTR
MDNVLVSKEKGGLAIHGVDGKLGCSLKTSYSSNWNDIVRELSLLHDKGMDLLGLIKKKTGKGENTMIYALESNKKITVAAKIAHPGMFSSLLRISRCGVEQEQLMDLCSNVEGLILPNMLDRWFWSLSGTKEFSVASVQNFIDDHILVEIAHKTRWIKAVPKKVNIHAWRVKMDNLLMRFNLSRRGMDLDSIFCPTCNVAVETTSHIFFDCSMVKDIYKRIASWWDINILATSTYEEGWAWFMTLRLPTKL